MPDMDISQRFNIGAELIEQNLRAGRGDAPAIWSGGKTLTYRDVEALTDRLASALLRAGVKPEQRVLFVLPDSPELAAGYLAAMKIGAVAVPSNPLLRPADYAYFVEESRARLLITSRACFERIEPALSQGSALRRVLVVGETGDRSFERWVAETPPQRVPTLYAAMLAQKEVPHDLSSLRLCVSAGEPLPGELFTRWKSRFGTEILDGIGSTEVLHIYVSPRRGHAKPDSTGVPVDGYEVRIIDENGTDVPRGETGDLIVRGPSTATMYFNRREQTRSKMRGEWFFTGDKFRQTEDGEFHYVGRSDDMFKAGAEWVSPTDVEAALVSHAAVLEAAVTPRADGGLLRPQAHVVLTEGRPETPELAEELRQHVRSRCAGYMVPKQIHFVKELPKTATGKIQRYLLRGQTS